MGCRDDYASEDSREGWARAFLFALETWFAGESVHFDFSHIRPYGARLKQMGGRASGAARRHTGVSNAAGLRTADVRVVRRVSPR